MRSLSLVLVLVTLLSSCTLFPTGDHVVTPPMGTGAVTTYGEDIRATSSQITETPEFESCMKMQTNMCIQSAGMQIAQKSKDPAFCKELPNPDQRSSCEYAITIVNAQDKNDITLCDTLTDANYLRQCKVQVYRQDAINKQDITLCNKIVDVYRTSTGEVIDNDAIMQKDQCAMQQIMTSTDATTKDCDILTDTGTTDMCKMMIKNKPKPSVLPAEQNQ